MTVRACLIVNPVAGRGLAARLLPRVARAFAARGITDVRPTVAPGDEARQVRAALDDGCDTIAVLGGDGTWSKAAAELARHGAPARLALIAAGTGNDFVKNLPEPSRDADAMARLVAGDAEERRIDMAAVDGELFLNVAGFAFDVAVLARTERMRWMRGAARRSTPWPRSRSCSPTAGWTWRSTASRVRRAICCWPSPTGPTSAARFTWRPARGWTTGCSMRSRLPTSERWLGRRSWRAPPTARTSAIPGSQRGAPPRSPCAFPPRRSTRPTASCGARRRPSYAWRAVRECCACSCRRAESACSGRRRRPWAFAPISPNALPAGVPRLQLSRMSKQPFTVGVIQDAAAADPRAALAGATARIREAAARGAQIICLKELFHAPYFCKAERPERFDLAEPIPGPTTGALQTLARELAVAIVVPLFEKQAPGVYRNSAAVIDADGTLLGAYRKMHIPDDPLYLEKYYFTPGDGTPDAALDARVAVQAAGFKVWKTRYANVGVLICWDQWYPEAARITALLGADVLVYPTAIGWHPAEKAEFGAAQVDAWRTAQRAHAVANGVYVAAANRVGFEAEPGTPGLEFFGHSFICDPFGRLVADAGTDPAVLIATCDPTLIEETRRNWPFLRDRRIDAYAPILQRYLGS